MKKILITVAILFWGCFLVRAQINVGSTSAPDASSILQLSPTNQGLRLPQVSLTSTTTFGLAGSATAACVGMQVYNTNAGITSADVVVYPVSSGGTGVYSWDGTGWKGLAPNSALPGVLEVHAAFSNITRGTGGTVFTFMSSNTTSIGIGTNTILGAGFTASTGTITLPAGTYLFSTTYYFTAGNFTGTNPAVHGFFYRFPSDVNPLGNNASTTDFAIGVPANNGTSSNSIGVTFSCMPTLTATRTCTLNVGWGDNNVGIVIGSLTYSGTVSFSITKLN